MSSNEVVKLFFDELKQYNSTNFRTIEKSKLDGDCNAILYKSFSSVVTRYFIFRERHPEINESTMHMLYYKLKIDMIARYFSEYPAASIEDLAPFQRELLRHVRAEKRRKKQNTPVPPQPVITEESITIGG